MIASSEYWILNSELHQIWSVFTQDWHGLYDNVSRVIPLALISLPGHTTAFVFIASASTAWALWDSRHDARSVLGVALLRVSHHDVTLRLVLRSHSKSHQLRAYRPRPVNPITTLHWPSPANRIWKQVPNRSIRIWHLKQDQDKLVPATNLEIAINERNYLINFLKTNKGINEKDFIPTFVGPIGSEWPMVCFQHCNNVFKQLCRICILFTHTRKFICASKLRHTSHTHTYTVAHNSAHILYVHVNTHKYPTANNNVITSKDMTISYQAD